MTPAELERLARRIYTDKPAYWKAKLARDLSVHITTIHRIMKRPEVPGPVEVAVRGMLEHKRRQDAIEREARKLLPVRLRKHLKGSRKNPPRKKRVPAEKPLDITTT